MSIEQDIAKIRRKIGDRLKSQKDVATGAVGERNFHLQFERVFGVTVTVADQEQEDGVDYTVNQAQGVVTFLEDSTPAAGAAIAFDYSWAAFTDDEIEEVLTDEGSVDAAIVSLIEELLVDTARFYDYQRGDTSSSRSQVFDHLEKLLSYHKKRITDSASGMQIRRRSHPLYEKDKAALKTDLSRYDG